MPVLDPAVLGEQPGEGAPGRGGVGEELVRQQPVEHGLITGSLLSSHQRRTAWVTTR